MDQHAMTSGVVPVRPPSYFPRVVKLPRRFEKAAMGDPKTARHRKVSLSGTPLHMRQSMSDRMDDLLTAIMWVKQELIFLRQHDILLKRQFFDIHDSIQTLQLEENNADAAAGSSYSSSHNHLSVNSSSHSNKHSEMSGQTDHISTISPSSRLSTASPLISLSSSPSPAQSPLTLRKKRQPNGVGTLCLSHPFLMDALTVRASSSATVLNNHDDDSDTDGDDTFNSSYFRPRTSSMKTSRDMAAIARRRGSKDLV